MTQISLDNAGRFGLLHDIALDSLPPEAWNLMTNVRCLEQVLQTFGADTEVYITGNGESPRFFIFVRDPVAPFWLSASNGKIYKITSGAHADVTKLATTYSGANGSVWCGFDFNRHQIFNLDSISDLPQVLLPGASNFVDLTNWPASTYCKFMTAYKNFLIAYNITEGATQYQSRIKWSDLADSGALPGSWDETDLTTLSGESDELEKDGGEILTARVLGDVNFIYKNNSIGMMYPRNDLRVFTIKGFEPDQGILGSHAIDGMLGKHYLMINGDVVENNGQRIASIIDKQNRKWLFDNLHEDYFARTQVVCNHQTKEVWVCFPDLNSSGWKNRALVYNVVEQTWGERELNDYSFIARGLIDTSGQSQVINDDSGIIDLDDSLIDATEYNPTISDLLGGDPTNDEYYQLDDVTGGLATVGSFERHGLTIVGRDRFGDWKYAAHASKQITRLYPKFSGSGSFNVYIGTSKTPDGAITWSGPEVYTIGSTPHVDFFNVTGEAISLKFEAQGTAAWKYSGCDMELTVVAENTF